MSTITTPDVLRAAVYSRISNDRRGDEAGIERQNHDAAALAAARGWTVSAPPYVDNDLSATKGVPRPGYRALLRSVAEDEVDAIIVWQLSRLWRNRRERADGIALLAHHGVSIFAVRGPDLDLSSAYGRGMAGLLGEFDTMESEVKSERVARSLEQNADAGRPHGRKAYGWDRVYDPSTGRARDVVNPEQAAVVREIADRILCGDSLRSIVADLNARGVLSPTGLPWGKQMLRAVVQRERNAGLRVHRGEVIGDASWEPIIDRGTFERVNAILRDPARRTSTGTTARHLLSGIARCGVCGSPMRAGNSRSVESYRCAERSCVSRRREPVDQYVSSVIIERLSRPDAVELLAPRGRAHLDAAAEARALETRLDEAADQFADGAITARQLERITARLRPQLDEALARARVVDDAPILHGVIGALDVATAWERLPLTRRRAVVNLLVDVRILRSRPGARSFDPNAVELDWK